MLKTRQRGVRVFEEYRSPVTGQESTRPRTHLSFCSGTVIGQRIHHWYKSPLKTLPYKGAGLLSSHCLRKRISSKGRMGVKWWC